MNPPVLFGSRTHPAGVAHLAIGPSAGWLSADADGCADAAPGAGGPSAEIGG